MVCRERAEGILVYEMFGKCRKERRRTKLKTG